MKKILISALVFLLMLGLSACTDANNNQEETSLDKKSTYTRVITDALGREVEIPAEINTIVPLGNTPRMIAYLGSVSYTHLPSIFRATASAKCF